MSRRVVVRLTEEERDGLVLLFDYIYAEDETQERAMEKLRRASPAPATAKRERDKKKGGKK